MIKVTMLALFVTLTASMPAIFNITRLSGDSDFMYLDKEALGFPKGSYKNYLCMRTYLFYAS